MMRFSRLSFVFLICNGFLSLFYYYFVVSSIPSEQTQLIRLEQLLALTALTFLYLSLCIKPLFSVLSLQITDPLKNIGRGSIISAWYFGLLHGLLAFFGQLGGFTGLGFLTGRYLVAIILSGCSLLLLTILILLFIPKIQKKLSNRVKIIGDVFLYIVGISILIHAVLLGTHFQDLGQVIPQIILCAVVFFFLLESQRLDAFLEKKYNFPRFGMSFVLVVGIIIAGVILIFSPQKVIPSLSIHSQHVQIAKQTIQDLSLPPAIPGMKGDRTRRFSVDIDTPNDITPNKDTTFQFTVYEASNGKKIELFDSVYEKQMHLIIVDQKLSYFSHIHPELEGSTFRITTKFPEEGMYQLYLNFQPLGAIEQQFSFTIPVGIITTNEPVAGIGDTRVTKDLGIYEITMNRPMHLQSSLISLGQQEISFSIKNRQTNSPVTTLKPYLAAFGHLVLINTRTFDYIHVHPTITMLPKPNENGGPDIHFMPLGLYGPIKPGTYKAFLQINPDNLLLTTDFILEID